LGYEKIDMCEIFCFKILIHFTKKTCQFSSYSCQICEKHLDSLFAKCDTSFHNLYKFFHNFENFYINFLHVAIFTKSQKWRQNNKNDNRNS
jgi:hypothetical protein